MSTIRARNVGPIHEAALEFGDLTLLVGPQASGKSILLQLVKLAQDRTHIRKVLEQHNFTWSKTSAAENLNRFFGEGMSGIWRSSTEVSYDGKPLTQKKLTDHRGESTTAAVERLFYVPAQRVFALENGWPRAFSTFDASVPYVLRQFSETIRLFLDSGSELKIFPATRRLKSTVRDAFNDSIFHGGAVNVHKEMRKSMRLRVGTDELPFMAWSAGQKEFLPLLLSFEYLCPPGGVSKRGDIEYVVLEEPEMGLHPKAIKAVILQTLDLVSRGYKVIVSTHSPVWLEAAWAFRRLSEAKASEKALFELFGVKPSNQQMQAVFSGLLQRKLGVYYFNREGSGEVNVQDISALDPADADKDMAEWGGLQSFGTVAAEVVAKSVPL